MPDCFSDWLLVSDIDGTLNNKWRQLPAVNKAAIKDFVDKGGHFTLASGRNLQSLTPHYKKLGISEPAIFLNGAGIYSFNENRMLAFHPHSKENEEILIKTAKAFPRAEVLIFTDKTVDLIKPRFFGYLTTSFDKLNHVKYNSLESVPRGNWGKLTFFGTPALLKQISEQLNSQGGEKLFEAVLTSGFTLEVMKKGVGKGKAVMELSEILGVNKRNTAGVGDYYNDSDMLLSVAHPVCCGQAPEEIKEISEYTACHCNKGAVADFINYIEQKYIIGGKDHG